ncbi:MULTISPECIES: ATP-binding protein [unclassified Streptomyces]|uniref:sensor histidine kinase n=1 Tax=unclassified Streptomyces TaxID=2593676 RepID=UPI001F3015C3|nr:MULTISPECIES: ATP-binding protein [unclassified Streptomyces]
MLGNAVKFTPAGGHVHVRARYEPATRHWVLRISDTGIGIPASFLDSLFEPFQRAANANRRRGSGLGLFITRGIVERHGGTVTATSTEGTGSTFTVELPLHPVSLRKRGES